MLVVLSAVVLVGCREKLPDGLPLFFEMEYFSHEVISRGIGNTPIKFRVYGRYDGQDLVAEYDSRFSGVTPVARVFVGCKRVKVRIVNPQFLGFRDWLEVLEFINEDVDEEG